MPNGFSKDGRSMLSLSPRVTASVLTLALGACAHLPVTNDAGAMSDPDGGVVDMPMDDAAMDDAAILPDGFAFSAPVLVSAVASVSGRFGDDVRVSVRASDADGDATSLSLGILDHAGTPVVLFDGNGDGVLDSNTTIVPMAEPIAGTGEGTGLVILPDFYRDVLNVDSIVVAVVDARGAASAPQTVALAPQPVIALDGVCDPSFVTNRCADGLGCPSAVPAVCVAGMAPMLTRVAYLGDPGAVRVLVEGSDVDDDVSELDIAFFDATGSAVSLDLDGDGIPESTHFGASLRDVASGGTFFYAFDASDVFATEVAAVSVVAVDRGMHSSAAVRASMTLAPHRTAGQTCDVHGFDRCTTSVCMPTSATAYHCVATSSARSMECSAATMLDALTGPGYVEGVAQGVSLWDAPAGCSSGDPVGRPEGVVRLHLPRHVSSLVLSTDNAYTTFDTTVYVMASCGAAPVLAWCADDTTSMRSWLSRLELTDVPAGDYIVVVDSFSPTGGRYRLDVTATE